MKKIVFFALTLAVLFTLAACSRNAAPSVTPDNTPSPSQTHTIDDGTTSRNDQTNGNDNGLVGEIGEGVGNAINDVGNAVGDTARGMGNAANNGMR